MTRSAASQQPRPSARSRTERHVREDPVNTRFSPKDSAPVPVPRPRAAASPWINVKEGARYVGVGVDAIYKGIANGTLRHSRLGYSTIRLRREWLDTWLESLARQTP